MAFFSKKVAPAPVVKSTEPSGASAVISADNRVYVAQLNALEASKGLRAERELKLLQIDTLKKEVRKLSEDIRNVEFAARKGV